MIGLGRGVFVFDEDTHTLRLKSELFDLRVGYANPILRLGESQRGVRILSYLSKNKSTNRKDWCFIFGAGRGIRTPVGLPPNGFQDWIVPLPGVHGSSLCILNFTAKKDKKRVKMDGLWDKCEKIVRDGQKSEKNSSKKLREIFHELEGSNVSLLWQKTDKK